MPTIPELRAYVKSTKDCPAYSHLKKDALLNMAIQRGFVDNAKPKAEPKARAKIEKKPKPKKQPNFPDKKKQHDDWEAYVKKNYYTKEERKERGLDDRKY